MVWQVCLLYCVSTVEDKSTETGSLTVSAGTQVCINIVKLYSGSYGTWPAESINK